MCQRLFRAKCLVAFKTGNGDYKDLYAIGRRNNLMRQFERDFPVSSCCEIDIPMVLSLIKDLPDSVSGGSRSSTNQHTL